MQIFSLKKATQEKAYLSEQEASRLLDAPHALTTEQYRYAFISLYFWRKDLFARDVCVRWTRDQSTLEPVPSPDFHRELWSLGRMDVLALVSRDHGKTTGVTKIEALWRILYEYEASILIVSSLGLGEKVIGDIRKELETNERINAIWGKLVPGQKGFDKSNKWRQRELELINGVELKTITKNEPVRGRRPTLVLVDDPEENKDVKNPAVAQEFYNWVFTSVYPTISPGGSMWVLGTIISHNCFVNRLKQDSIAKGFLVFEYPAVLGCDPKKDIVLDKNGKIRILRGTPLWPKRWSIQSLQARANKIGLGPFLQEYMNVPMRIHGTPVFGDYETTILEPISIIDHDIKIFRPLTEKDKDGKEILLYDGSMGIDVAFGSSSGDYSTITVRSMSGLLLAEFRGKIPQDILCRKVDVIRKLLKSCRVVPENNVALAFLNESKKYDWHTEIYRKISFDKIVNKETEELGWRTTSKTKPMMVSDLDQMMRENAPWELSKDAETEIKNFYHDEKGGMNAIAPYHDDLVISEALAVQGMKLGVVAPGLAWL